MAASDTTGSQAHRVDVVGAASASVTCTEDQPLLDAFLRNGVYLPNSCNQGTCGTCKVCLCSGTVDAPEVPETVLGADDQARGFVLACQSRPRSDTTIEVEAPEQTGPRHRLRDVVGTVHGIETVAHDTVTVLVDIDEPLDFSAGQYMEIAVPGTGEWRQYSMANPPASASRLEFQIRRVTGGVATDGWIFGGLDVGHELEMRGPWGDFAYEPDADEPETPMLLLAGGTGLAPLTSIAVQALTDDPDREIHLYHGVRHEADLYHQQFWREVAERHRGLTYVPCLSRSEWDGRTGYVGDAVLDDFASLRGYVAYLCGPPAMVDAGVKACKRRRMPARNIRREKYTPSGLVPAGLSA